MSESRIQCQRFCGSYGKLFILIPAFLALLGGLILSGMIIYHQDRWTYCPWITEPPPDSAKSSETPSKARSSNGSSEESSETPSSLYQNLSVFVGTLVLAVWTFWLFLVNREAEAALELELTCDSTPDAKENLYFMDVILQNTGKAKFHAMPKRKPLATLSEFKKDPDRLLPYSATLQLKRLPPVIDLVNEPLTWHHPAVFKRASISVNLLDSYEIESRTKGKDGKNKIRHKPDFWMEPGETYHLGQILRIPVGRYLARIVVIGIYKGEFWTRLFHLTVNGVEIDLRPRSGLSEKTS